MVQNLPRAAGSILAWCIMAIKFKRHGDEPNTVQETWRQSKSQYHEDEYV